MYLLQVVFSHMFQCVYNHPWASIAILLLNIMRLHHIQWPFYMQFLVNVLPASTYLLRIIEGPPTIPDFIRSYKSVSSCSNNDNWESVDFIEYFKTYPDNDTPYHHLEKHLFSFLIKQFHHSNSFKKQDDILIFISFKKIFKAFMLLSFHGSTNILYPASRPSIKCGSPCAIILDRGTMLSELPSESVTNLVTSLI